MRTVSYTFLDNGALHSLRGVATKRRQALQWLSQVDYSAHHEKARDLRFEATGEWLFGKPGFQTWFETEGSSVMWLSGKGMIAATSQLFS